MQGQGKERKEDSGQLKDANEIPSRGRDLTVDAKRKTGKRERMGVCDRVDEFSLEIKDKDVAFLLLIQDQDSNSLGGGSKAIELKKRRRKTHDPEEAATIVPSCENSR